MAKATESIKQNQENKKEKKKMKRSNWETIKTVIIAVLITAILGFVAGIHYQRSQSDQVKAEAASIVKNVKVEVSQAQSKQ